ncbi:MAG: hypothetical protein F4X24_02575 [Rhodobacteraceae bacterium]|nr:hypothetical protein [Paracoccaceae bacterium]
MKIQLSNFNYSKLYNVVENFKDNKIDRKDINKQSLSWSDIQVYSDIHHAIDQMARLPKDNNLNLDKNIAHKALNLLGYFKEQLKIRPPKIINQDGEALAYTWVIGNIKRYLIVADEEVSLMDLTLDGQDSYEEVLSQDDNLPLNKIKERLLVQTNSLST